MCDVMVAMPDATRHADVVFGKNSDRPAGECQVLYSGRARSKGPESWIQCSYVRLPESEDTLATLGCRPYWCWGYETGLNEAGVVGGNVAVFTRALRQAKHQVKPGLTGMDLLRLGLERGRSAEEALQVIATLLERHGQWGSAVRGKDHQKGSYENAFLLADRKAAWVMETSGRSWVAERVSDGVRSISNQLTIRRRWSKASPGVEDLAAESEWWNPETGDLDFAFAFGDHENYSRQVSHLRWKRTSQLLERNRGLLDAPTMMGILRDHYEDTFLEGPQFHPYLPDFQTVCMHDSPAGFTWGDTATSVVVEIDPQGVHPPLLWVAYLPPCTSIYMAFTLSGDLPDAVSRVGDAGLKVRRPSEAPVDQFSPSALWWRLHRIVRAVKKDPSDRRVELRSVLDPIERRHIQQVTEMRDREKQADGAEWNQVAAEHVSEVIEALGQIETRWKIARAT